MKQAAPHYRIIEGSEDWSERCREFCRKAYRAAYVRPELGVTEDLFTKEIYASPRIVEYFRKQCIRSDTRIPFLALDNNDELLGMVSVHRLKDYCEMSGFYVKPELKGHGIGHALYQEVLHFAGDLPIQVDVIEYMHDTIEMYKHWGFHIDESKGKLRYPITEWPELAVDNYQAIYMVKPGRA